MDVLPDEAFFTNSRHIYSTRYTVGLVPCDSRATAVPIISKPYKLLEEDFVTLGGNAKYRKGLWESMVTPGDKTVTTSTPLKWEEKKPVAIMYGTKAETRDTQENLRRITNEITNQTTGTTYFYLINPKFSHEMYLRVV